MDFQNVQDFTDTLKVLCASPSHQRKCQKTKFLFKHLGGAGGGGERVSLCECSILSYLSVYFKK